MSSERAHLNRHLAFDALSKQPSMNCFAQATAREGVGGQGNKTKKQWVSAISCEQLALGQECKH
eukprot:1139105-Pelagomonas_calceolata.AAC.2